MVESRECMLLISPGNRLEVGGDTQEPERQEGEQGNLHSGPLTAGTCLKAEGTVCELGSH